jgi:hypothetical protein
MYPSSEIVSLVMTSPYKAARDPGRVVDPSASVPIETGAYPAETATAEPTDDPPGLPCPRTGAEGEGSKGT